MSREEFLTKRLAERSARLCELQDALQRYLDGDYPNPRDSRPGKCEHGVYYWEQCGTCNDNFLAAALAASRVNQ